MKFSTKSTYGLRAMINLAKSGRENNISLSKIAKEEKISQGYLERIFSNLKKAEIVKSEKGAAGGYILNKDPRNISVYEIIKASEGEKSSFHCVEKGDKVYCGAICKCGVEPVLLNIEQAINKTLKNIKLNDLV